jgi:cytoskeleton protein RodZ
MVRVPSAVLAAAILMALALVLWFWLPERSSTSVITPEPALPLALPSVDQSEPNDDTAVSETSTVPESQAAAADAAAALAGEPEVTTTQSAEWAPGVLQILASDTVWVQIVGASGRVILQRSLEAQESVGFSADLPLSVVVGRADEVTVRVRDQDFDLEPWARGNVARFEVQ